MYFQVAAEDPSSSPPDFIDRRDHATSLESVAAARQRAAALTGAGEPQQLLVGGVTGRFFDVLGVAPTLGRIVFPAAEGEPEKLAVLSYGLWQQSFGGDAGAVGRSIHLDGMAVGYLTASIASKLLLGPLLGIGIIALLDIQQPVRNTLLVCACLPTAINAISCSALKV